MRFYFEKTKMVSQTAIHKQLLFRTINVFLLWCRRFHSVYVCTGVCLCSSCGRVRVCGMHATCLPTVWLTSPQGHEQAVKVISMYTMALRVQRNGEASNFASHRYCVHLWPDVAWLTPDLISIYIEMRSGNQTLSFLYLRRGLRLPRAVHWRYECLTYESVRSS